MKQILTLVWMLALIAMPVAAQKGGFPEIKQLQGPQNPRLGFVIHGGAGVIKKGSLTPEQEKEYRVKLEEAVTAGYKALQAGKTSVEAVEVAIRILEDSPLFNAGKGAVFTADGKNELDASIMDGKTLMAGAVAGLHHVKNPISLARAVMEKSPHVMMIGDGAEQFAKEQKIELVDEKYFFTQRRWDELQQEQQQQQQAKPSVGLNGYSEPSAKAFGTVGAVALDKFGNIAAGTSTGGMTNKKYGRVGDSPVIGAGTYASNNTCGVSATGWGEYFIRLDVDCDISAMMEYRALPIQQSADIVMKKVQSLGGDGGVIAMDKWGNIGLSLNSEGMYRAYINNEGKAVVEIYKGGQ